MVTFRCPPRWLKGHWRRFNRIEDRLQVVKAPLRRGFFVVFSKHYAHFHQSSADDLSIGTIFQESD